MPIKIFLADDHRIFRQAVRTLIELQSDMEVVGESGTGRSTVDRAAEARPDIAIMDVSMPNRDNVELIKEIIAGVPGIKVIGLSVYSEGDVVSAFLEAGVAGYLLKDCAFEELVDAIKKVNNGEKHVTAKASETMEEKELRMTPFRARKINSGLTRREREILQDWVTGMGEMESASHLKLSPKTIGTYRHTIKQKLAIRTVPGLVRYAVRHGLTTL
jgi:two-component system response regulator NreC